MLVVKVEEFEIIGSEETMFHFYSGLLLSHSDDVMKETSSSKT